MAQQIKRENALTFTQMGEKSLTVPDRLLFHQRSRTYTRSPKYTTSGGRFSDKHKLT